ncbi:hypothetical protein ISN45_Aa02g011200 [Arabidopsis thaliana x Arabidopsis arenosa]|uniref:Uncharacterized protein n=1 Tax=Arabidopsis thaliana x Arabidopsis arenosa TaxID=1240361 RepID=A0A8T2BJV5_9BRAS|nr:hypothetical protein ISN45_Aa02g011200 [Arabidopsis thaliana x Arabidopsis arenosa]
MDLTRDQVQAAILALRPDLILFDLAHWVPEMAKAHKVKSMLYNVISATSIAHDLVPGGELGVPPPGYPSSKALDRKHDTHALLPFSGFYKRFYHRLTTGLMNCDRVVPPQSQRELSLKNTRTVFINFQVNFIIMTLMSLNTQRKQSGSITNPRNKEHN